MIDDLELLYLQAPVGKGQENNPDDVEALDGTMRKIGAYAPPPEYADNPQRYTTEPVISALERYQEKKGLKIDGVAKPGGPTERSLNNDLLEKPRGGGLLYDPPAALAGAVGSGFDNRREDVASIQRRLGALGYIPEDPFDKPHGFIDERTTNGIREFQRSKGLADDGWLAPRGETERALENAVSNLGRAKGREWLGFVERAVRAQQAGASKFTSTPDSVPYDVGETEGGIEPAKVTLPWLVSPRPVPAIPGRSGQPPLQPPIPLDPPNFFGVDPRFLPPPRPQLRWSDPLPRDLTITNPGERVDGPQPPPPPIKLPPGVRVPEDEPLSTNDIPRALGLPPNISVDDEVKRALPIMPRRINPDVYHPEPGSPLRIPIIDIHHGGMRGDPRTIQTTRATTEAIEKACREVFGKDEVSFETKMERHYPGDLKGTTKGSSFADEWVGMTVKAANVTLNFVSDSYTSRVDGSPIADEDRRFVKLEYNRRHGKHEITVRVPKVWKFGQTLDNERLYEVAKEICEQIKKAIDDGEIGRDKGYLRVVKTLEELVKPKKRPASEAKEPPEPQR